MATGDSGTDEKAAGPARPDYEVGLLLVHGIGNQTQGATLTQWSDSLVSWLRTWVPDRSSRPTSVTIPETQLSPIDGSPAHLTMHLDVQRPRRHGASSIEEPGFDRHQWLVAEGWWAATFAPPKFSELWTWSFRAVPAILALHANRLFQQAHARFSKTSGRERITETIRVALLMLMVIVFIALSPVVLLLGTVLLLAGAIVGALPIGGLKNAVARVQLILVGTVGDSLRLLESPTQAGAIKAPVANGIRFLREQGCKRVVVLAHSQGAAVSYQVLADIANDRDEGIDPIDSFITVGSGLPKVAALAALAQDRSVLGLRNAATVAPVAAAVFAVAVSYLRLHGEWTGLIGAGAIGAATFAALLITRSKLEKNPTPGIKSAITPFPPLWGRWSIRGGDGRERFALHSGPVWLGAIAASAWTLITPLGLITLVATISGVLVVVGILVVALGAIPEIEDGLSRSTNRWIDLYAAKDPVPAGPTQTSEPGRPESWPISNLRSSMRDHTYYTSNLDECMTYVGIEMLEVSGVKLQARAERQATARYGFKRRWRVAWRFLLTWYLVTLGVIFALRTWGRSDDHLDSGYRTVFGGQDPLFDRLSPIDRPNFLAGDLGAGAPWVAALLYIAGTLLLVQVGQKLWGAWNATETRVELTTEPNEQLELTFPVQLRLIIMLLALMTWIAAWPDGALRAWHALEFETWSSLGLAALLVLSVLAFGVLPSLLRLTGFQSWFMRPDKSRVESLVRHARQQSLEGKHRDAEETFERAVRLTRSIGVANADLHGSFAHAIDVNVQEKQSQLADLSEAARPDAIAQIDGLVDNAKDHFKQAHEANRVHVPNLLHRANFTSIHGKEWQARALALRAVRLEPHDAGALGCAARLLFSGGQTDAARGLMARLLWLRKTTTQAVHVDSMLLAARFAQLTSAGPDDGRGPYHEILRLLDQGVRAIGVDLRFTLHHPHHGWNDVQRAVLADLGSQISTPGHEPAHLGSLNDELYGLPAESPQITSAGKP